MCSLPLKSLEVISGIDSLYIFLNKKKLFNHAVSHFHRDAFKLFELIFFVRSLDDLFWFYFELVSFIIRACFTYRDQKNLVSHITCPFL